MNFEKNSNPIDDSEREPVQEGSRLFELRKVIKGIDVSINIEKEGGPISGVIDLENKSVSANLTPEGIRTGMKAMSDFFERPDVQETVDKTLKAIQTKLHESTERMNERNADLRKRRDELNEKIQEAKRRRNQKPDEETIRKYAKQEGMSEAEVVDMILSEFED